MYFTMIINLHQYSFYGYNHEINLYIMQTMESGSISAWNVKAGDSVVAGDVYASIETDKAVVDFEAQDDAIIAQVLVSAGTEVKVNTPVMILVSDPNHVAAFENYTAADAAQVSSISSSSPEDTMSATAAVTAVPTASASVVTSPSKGSNSTGGAPTGLIVASPLARKLAQEKGYDIAAISGTGPNGRIIAADVKEYQPQSIMTMVESTTTSTTAIAAPDIAKAATTTSSSTAAPVIGSGYVDYPIPITASDVAARLAQSKRNVPHYYLTVDINADALIQLRATMNAHLSSTSKAPKGDVTTATNTLGIYEFIIKAAGLSMRTVPSANAAWMESHVRVYNSVDVNVVMGAGESLRVRTIRNITGIGIQSIKAHLTSDVDSSSNILTDDGLGTFTMINVGMYGVKSCAPIIREPQACAIAIGALQSRIVPSSDTDGGYAESVQFTVTASFDHRVVDGAVGAQWLAALKSYIENPSTLLL
jgi:pyruvate dehydrogenase E2 component (dihydrolipoamide acetyltransferase)